jgi:hypothetical protein
MYLGSPDNFRYVLSLRIHDTNVLSGSINRREVAAAWESQGLVFSQKITELIKHHGDKRRTYDVIPLDWGINNYDVYNRNRLIETVIFYTYIIFISIQNLNNDL